MARTTLLAILAVTVASPVRAELLLEGRPLRTFFATPQVGLLPPLPLPGALVSLPTVSASTPAPMTFTSEQYAYVNLIALVHRLEDKLDEMAREQRASQAQIRELESTLAEAIRAKGGMGAASKTTDILTGLTTLGVVLYDRLKGGEAR